MELKHHTFYIANEGDPHEDFLWKRMSCNLIRRKIFGKLSRMPSGTVLEIDFITVPFIGVMCAYEIIVRILARLEAGELPGRYIILSHVDEENKQNINFALSKANKTIIVNNGKHWCTLGNLVDSYANALSVVIERQSASSKDVQKELAYANVNSASTKLIALYKKGLIAREHTKESAKGGGSQFRYLSLLPDTTKHKEKIQEVASND